MNRIGKSDGLWSIILGAGEGEGVQQLVQRWLGRQRPKQYCAFIGTRSMLQHTLDRADLLSDPEHKVTIAARAHRWDALAQPAQSKAGKLILQPANRGSVAEIFLGLTYVRAYDRDATVVLYPSDHFVYPEERFVKVIQSAVLAAQQVKNWLFLLGISPERLDQEHDWILLGPHLGWIDGHRVQAVAAFLEKPNEEKRRAAPANRALGNTMTLVAKLETLWAMGWQYIPEIMPLFETYQEAIGTSEEEAVLEAQYEVMPCRNFSSNLLTCVRKQVAAIELSGVLWCNWNTPERIAETLRQIGKSPLPWLVHAPAVSKVLQAN
jgi:mannose-1-phosphate guanylyltransferase